MSVYPISKFSATELFIQDIDHGYSNVPRMPIYSMSIDAGTHMVILNEVRLVRVLENRKSLSFRFISMNRYSRRSYYPSCGNTDIVIDKRTNVMSVVHLSFMGTTRDKDGEVVDGTDYAITPDAIHFFLYLHKTHPRMNLGPRSRM